MIDLAVDICLRNNIAPGYVVAHKSLEGDRRDGGVLLEAIRAAVAAAQAKPVQVDVTDYNNPGHVWHCTATDKWLTDDQGFRSYHQQHGGIEIFGLPLDGAHPNEADATQIDQNFERGRFEYHADGKIYLGRVNAERLSLLAACKGCAGK